MNVSVCLFFCILTVVNSEVLHEQSDDVLNPLNQAPEEVEPSDQSKRTLFDSHSPYGLEKHMRIHPSGYKYLLGYRPVKLQFVPVVKPLYVHSAPKFHYSVKPVVTLLPPKTLPVFKSAHLRNQWKFGKLAVNVPPSAPSRPWQHQGWTPLAKPFVASVPLPDNKYLPSPPPRGPLIPIIPTSASVPLNPSSPPLHPLLPVHPVLPVAPSLPQAPIPIHPSVNVHPALPVHINLQHGIHFDASGRPLVPINYLPGKLNLPVPDLGVLPLGATVPVQSAVQVEHHPPLLAKVPQHFFHKFPGGVINHGPLPLYPPPQPVLPYGIQPIVHQPVPQIQHSLVQQPLPQPHIEAVPQQPLEIHTDHHIQHQLDHHIQHQPDHHIQHQPDHHIQHQPDHHIQHQPDHNYQYFTQHGHTHQFHQETLPQPLPQPDDHNYPHQYQQFEPQPLEEPQETPGFFQPGKTDLQIPDYLPAHPHLRQTFIPSQQDPNVDPYGIE